MLSLERPSTIVSRRCSCAGRHSLAPSNSTILTSRRQRRESETTTKRQRGCIHNDIQHATNLHPAALPVAVRCGPLLPMLDNEGHVAGWRAEEKRVTARANA